MGRSKEDCGAQKNLTGFIGPETTDEDTEESPNIPEAEKGVVNA